MDKDGSGFLDETKIHTAAAKMGVNLTIEEVSKIVEDFDIDKDGFINWIEFLKAVSE